MLFVCKVELTIALTRYQCLLLMEVPVPPNAVFVEGILILGEKYCVHRQFTTFINCHKISNFTK